jgi:putative salt-induced outer membrane protein
MNKLIIVGSALASSLTLSPQVFAQAEGLMKQDAATSGKTDVATSGFEAVAKDDPEAKDATEAKISAGALLTTGNSRSLAATGASTMRVRREKNQLSAAAAVNYSRSAAAPGVDMETTVENYQGKIRYDRFIAGNLALFMATSARRDRFQGLDLRLNLDPGVAYYFVDEKAQQLWTELGYDFQYDVRRDENVAAALASGDPVDKTDVQHSGRLFAGYNNAINEHVTFTTGVEYLQGIPETERWRLNWDTGLTSSIGGNFSLNTTFSLKYDHAPLPGVKELDTSTAVSLVYQLL